MSQQTHEQAIQATRVCLEAKELNDRGVDLEFFEPKKLLRGTGGLSVIVGQCDCLVHDSAYPSRWRYYQLPTYVENWAMNQSSARLWLVTVRDTLATLDLRNNEWMEFGRAMRCAAILHAEEDVVIVLRKTMFVIDVLKLQDERIQRVTSLTIPIVPADQVNFAQNPAYEYAISDVVFLPEENQFIILRKLLNKMTFTLQRLSWNGHEETVLSVEAESAKLRFPFVVLYSKSQQELAYADLRKKPITVKHFSLNLGSKGYQGARFLSDVFTFEDELVASLLPYEPGNRSAQVFIRLTGDRPEVLHEDKGWFLQVPSSTQLGGLVICYDALLDLANQKKMKCLSLATLLRRAIQDEAKRQQRAPNAKPSLPPAQETKRTGSSAFSISLQTLSTHVKEVFDQNIQFQNAVSSAQGDLAFFLDSSVYDRRTFLLLKDKDQIQYLLPQLRDGWYKVTFDEQGRVWLCDGRKEHIAVLHPRKQEGFGFIMDPLVSSWSKAMAAFANHLAIACRDNTFLVHYYDGNSLTESFKCQIDSEISGIKPDTKNGGWWIVTTSNIIHELKYISPNTDSSDVKTIEQIPYPVAILGDWPEQVYFVYVDDAHQLHYTLDPLDGWHTVPLQDIIGKTQDDDYVQPLFLHSLNNSIFILLETPDAYFFVHAQAGIAELVATFQLQSGVFVAHWGDWLVFHSNQSLVPARYHVPAEGKEEIILPPENKGTLFFHTPTRLFMSSPHAPYSVIDALRKMPKSAHNIIRKTLI